MKRVDSSTREYFYKYTDFSEGSLDIIRRGTLKFTHPSQFNDPFESEFVFNKKSIDELEHSNPELVRRAAEFLDKKPRKPDEWLEELKDNARSAIDSGVFTKGLLKNIGVLSLTKNPDNLLMWAHYACSHQGFVVGFELDTSRSDEELLIEFAPVDVKYRESRPVIDWGAAGRDDVDKFLLTKSFDWAYENEYRAIDYTRGSGFHEYSRKDFLNCVIAGARMNPDNLKRLENIVKEVSCELGTEIAFFQAEVSKDKYQIDIPGFY